MIVLPFIWFPDVIFDATSRVEPIIDAPIKLVDPFTDNAYDAVLHKIDTAPLVWKYDALESLYPSCCPGYIPIHSSEQSIKSSLPELYLSWISDADSPAPSTVNPPPPIDIPLPYESAVLSKNLIIELVAIEPT